MDYIIYSGQNNKPSNDAEVLGAEIAKIAISLGFITPEQPLTGVQLVALCAAIHEDLEANDLVIEQAPTPTVEQTVEKVVSEQAEQDSVAPSSPPEVVQADATEQPAATTPETPPVAAPSSNKAFSFTKPRVTTPDSSVGTQASSAQHKSAQAQANGAAHVDAPVKTPAQTQDAPQATAHQPPAPPKAKFSFTRPRV